MEKLALVFGVLIATSLAIPVEQNPHGLGAALSSIANSFVVVSDDTVPSNGTQVQADEPTVHLESANALPSLTHIALTADAHHIKAETATLVYTNDTDAQGVVQISIVSVEEDDSSEESTTVVTTERDEEDATTIPESGKLTTTSTATAESTTMTAVLTVLGRDQVDKEKEEEIKANIKEVEAMPVILTVGV